MKSHDLAAPAASPDLRIPIKRIVHVIHAVADLARCRQTYLDVLGGLIFAESVFEPEDRAMALLYVADLMIEPMEPLDHDRLEMPLARYIKRYGERLQSFEIAVEDGLAANAKLKDAGCKFGADYGNFFFLRPESTGGVLLEVCDTPMPNDPWSRGRWRHDWIIGHASTLRQLDHIACVVRDATQARMLFTEMFDGALLHDELIGLPQPARRIAVRLADKTVAFIQPDDRDEGPLGAFLRPPTSGVYALVWRVEDETAAEAFFVTKGLRTTREGCVSGGFAIDPRDFLGSRHEFTSLTAAKEC